MKTEDQNNYKNMYVINLDSIRVFWIIAIFLFIITFFFLIGYWLGHSNKYMTLNEKNIEKKNNSIALNLQKLNEFNDFVISNQLISNKKKIYAIDKNKNIIFDTKNKIINHGKNKKEKIKIKKIKNNLFINKTFYKKNKLKKSKNNLLYKKLKKNKLYSIQVSSNRIKSNATKLKNKLFKNGFKAYINIKNTNAGYLLYHVRVGLFSKYNEAVNFTTKLKQYGIKDILIISNKNI